MNYLSNQHSITLFAYLFNQSACYCSLIQLFNVLLQFFALLMITSTQHNTR